MSVEEPWALTASMAAFAANWRDSNYAVRADNHKNKKTVKMKIMEVRVKSLHGIHLTRHQGIEFGQPRSDGAGLLLSRVKGGLGNPEVNLQLAVLPSHLGVTVLSHPPLMKIAPGVVAVVGIRRFQRRGRHRRCGVRRPTGPRKGTETIIHNKLVGESELFIIINKKYRSHLMRRRR